MYRDIRTGTTNDQVTSGDRGRLKGNHLRFDIAQAEEGVFFIHRRSGCATRVEEMLEANLDDPRLPHELAFLAPASLQPGTYILKARSRTRKGAVLRSGRLKRLLTVSEASSGP